MISCSSPSTTNGSSHPNDSSPLVGDSQVTVNPSSVRSTAGSAAVTAATNSSKVPSSSVPTSTTHALSGRPAPGGRTAGSSRWWRRPPGRRPARWARATTRARCSRRPWRPSVQLPHLAHLVEVVLREVGVGVVLVPEHEGQDRVLGLVVGGQVEVDRRCCRSGPTAASRPRRSSSRARRRRATRSTASASVIGWVVKTRASGSIVACQVWPWSRISPLRWSTTLARLTCGLRQA